MFINFFQNSIDAIQQRIESDGGEAGRLDVAVEPTGDAWQITIRDNGIGIPPENLPKIFDPFFTSKDVGKGMGLGLSITHQILQSHKALIEVDSRPGRYTSFRIVFPKLNFNDEPGPESVLDQPAWILHRPAHRSPHLHPTALYQHEHRDRRLRLSTIRHPLCGWRSQYP